MSNLEIITLLIACLEDQETLNLKLNHKEVQSLLDELMLLIHLDQTYSTDRTLTKIYSKLMNAIYESAISSDNKDTAPMVAEYAIEAGITIDHIVDKHNKYLKDAINMMDSMKVFLDCETSATAEHLDTLITDLRDHMENNASKYACKYKSIVEVIEMFIRIGSALPSEKVLIMADNLQSYLDYDNY